MEQKLKKIKREKLNLAYVFFECCDCELKCLHSLYKKNIFVAEHGLVIRHYDISEKVSINKLFEVIIMYCFDNIKSHAHVILYHLFLLSKKITLCSGNIFGALIGISGILSCWIYGHDAPKQLVEVFLTSIRHELFICKYSRQEAAGKIRSCMLEVYKILDFNVPDPVLIEHFEEFHNIEPLI